MPQKQQKKMCIKKIAVKLQKFYKNNKNVKKNKNTIQRPIIGNQN